MITRRQWEFIRYYVDTMNATKSAILAGYKEKNASSYVVRLMKNPEILTEIKERIDKKHNITKEEYELRTLKLHEEEDNKSVKARYWELLGEVKGYRKHQDVNVTVNNIGEDTLNRIKNKRLVNNPTVSPAPMLNNTHAQETKGG